MHTTLDVSYLMIIALLADPFLNRFVSIEVFAGAEAWVCVIFAAIRSKRVGCLYDCHIDIASHSKFLPMDEKNFNRPTAKHCISVKCIGWERTENEALCWKWIEQSTAYREREIGLNGLCHNVPNQETLKMLDYNIRKDAEWLRWDVLKRGPETL